MVNHVIYTHHSLEENLQLFHISIFIFLQTDFFKWIQWCLYKIVDNYNIPGHSLCFFSKESNLG